MSVVSDTDHVIFKVLSNPERVDLARIEEVATDGVPVYEAAPPLVYEEPPSFPPPPPPVEEEHRPPAEEYRPPAVEEEYRPPAVEEEYRPPPPPQESRPPEEETIRPQEEAPTLPADDTDARRTVLLDLRRLEMQGVRLSKEWSMDDRLEDMMLEMRRHTLAMDEMANVNMMRDGMRLLVTGIEMVNTRYRILDLEGWSSEVCRDLHKHDAQLSRIYRKYWKRSSSNAPEVDICLSLLGSMGLHHMKRKMSKQMMAGTGFGGGGASSFRRPPRRAATPPSSDDEGLPP